MKKLYEKNELAFAIVWIVVYCVLQSLANPLNMLGTFANDTSLTTETQLLHLAVLIVIAIVYTLILTRTLPKKEWGHTNVGS